ncbi:MAG: hypothetical protein HYR96_12585 [Deltaproteobacteria bacterium]|nr:hypothetical protein [Deltaproteobacteria bacterium]MBI3293374.1 hypothetical protein [Deltaproteobacteria bacterium]
MRLQWIVLIGVTFLGLGCNVTKKTAVPVRIATPESLPVPTPASEQPFAFGTFVNTLTNTFYGSSWVEVIHWTLDIKKGEVFFGAICEFEGTDAGVLKASVSSRSEILFDKSELRILEARTAQTTKAARTCSVQTLPGVYRFERNGTVLRLEHNDGVTRYFFKRVSPGRELRGCGKDDPSAR